MDPSGAMAFAIGDRVMVRQDPDFGPGPWPAEPTGTIAKHPLAAGDDVWVSTMTVAGARRSYWVVFDQAQFDTDGDGAYEKAEVLDRYLLNAPGMRATQFSKLMKESVVLSPAGQPAPSTRLLVVFALIALAVVALGGWVYANQGLGMAWFYSVLVTALVALFWFAPYARTCGRPGEGAIAVWLAIFLGPLSLVALIPWMTGLAARFDAEQGK